MTSLNRETNISHCSQKVSAFFPNLKSFKSLNNSRKNEYDLGEFYLQEGRNTLQKKYKSFVLVLFLF